MSHGCICHLIGLLGLLTTLLVVDSLPEPPGYLFVSDEGICVYNGTAVDHPSYPDYQCFLPLDAIQAKVSLEIDLEDNAIFIASNKHIFSAKYVDDPELTLLALSAGEIFDLSFDWLAHNLYFVDKQTDAIRVVNSRGDHGVTLLEGIDNIFGVAVDPINRYLFWCVASSDGSAVAKSALDGTGRNDSFFTRVAAPTALVVDHEDKRIYWTDLIKGSIESVDFDGNNHEVLVEDQKFYSYGLTVDEDHVIWFNNIDTFPEVYWTNKSSGNHSQYDYHYSLSGLHDIVFFGEYSQPTGHTNGCLNNNGGCSHLCFAISDTHRQCQCSMGFVLADDDTSCEPVPRGDLEDSLLVGDAGRGTIYYLNTNTHKVSGVPIPIQSDVQDLACDPLQGHVFWSNINNETIMRAKLDGSGQTAVKTFPEGHTIVGLAVDYLRQLVFYCDIEDAGLVASVSYSGANHKDIWHENHTVAIVPDIHNQHLYLAVVGLDSRITRIDYNGANEKIIKDNLYQPLSLTIDFAEGRIYWFDSGISVPTLEWSSLYGTETGRWPVSWKSSLLSLVATGPYIYLVDWGADENQVGRIKKDDPSSLIKIGPTEFFHISRISSCSIVQSTTRPTITNPELTTTPELTPTTAPTGGQPPSNNSGSDKQMDGLPELPGYLFVSDEGICVYNGMAVDHQSFPDYHCFLPLYTSGDKVSLEIDLEDNAIFIASNEHILSAKYVDDPELTLLARSAGEILDFSFDWLAHNLYFVDKQTDAIRVVNSRGDHCVTLLEGIDNIIGVAVDPINRYLFWCVASSNGSAIAKSALDGTGRDDSFFTRVTAPMALVVDHEDKRIYWTDLIKGSIESVDFDGNNHEILVEDPKFYSYGLTVDEDHVIWFNNVDTFPEVYWTNKSSGKHSQYDYHFSFSGLHDIVFFGEYSQPTGHPNGCSNNNGGCSHLCFAVSDTDRKCQCSMGFVLADDGTSCEPVPRGGFGDNLLLGDTGRGALYIFNTNTYEVSGVPIPIQSDVGDVACDPLQGHVFWSNSINKTIMRANLDGSNQTVMKTFSEGHTIVGLAVDYLRQLVFYCDIEDAGLVASVSYSGANHKDIWHENHTVAIVPDIDNQHLYLAIVGPDSRITRIDYNGANEKIINDNLYRPLSMTIDFAEGRIYWFDAGIVIPTLEWSSLYGNETGGWLVSWKSSLLSLVATGPYIYLVDWGTDENQVGRIEKNDSSSLIKIGPDEFFHISRISSCPIVDVQSTKRPTTNPELTTTPELTSTTVQPPSDNSGSDKQMGNQQSNDHNTVNIVAAVAGTVAVIVIVAVIIVGCIVYRKRNSPPENLIVNDTAFENPGYGEITANNAVINDESVQGATVGYSKDEVHIYQSLGLPPKQGT